MKKLYSFVFAIALNLFCGDQSRAAGDLGSQFTLEGTLYSDTVSSAPLLDNSVSLKLQILDPRKACVLYSETQTVDTSLTSGDFRVRVGSNMGDSKRSASEDPGNSMAKVFQNSIGIASHGCGNNPYVPQDGDTRYLKITVRTSDGAEQVLNPELEIDSVPRAMVANTLQGYSPSQMIIQNSAELTQANVQNVFSSTNYPRLQDLLAVPAANYLRSDSDSGVRIPNLNAHPASPDLGTVWYHAGLDKMVYEGQSGPVVVGTSGGSVQSVTVAGLPLTVASSSTTPQISIAQANASAAGYLSSADWVAFNNKQAAGTYLSSIAVGDVTTALGFTPLSASLAPNQVYIGNGSNLATAGFFGIGQMRNSVGALQFPTSCAASQTLTWSAVTDALACSNIGSLPASAISSGTIDSARLPFGANLWLDGGSNRIYYSAGNVGIGTTSPLTALHLGGAVGSFANGLSFSNGTSGIFESAAGTMSFNLSGASRWFMSTGLLHSTTGSGPALSTTGNASVRPRYNEDTGVGWVAAGKLGLFTTGTQRMIFDGANVGIGTPSPTAAFNVSSTAATDIFKLTSNGGDVVVDQWANLSSPSAFFSKNATFQGTADAGNGWNRLLIGSNVVYNQAADYYDLSTGAAFDRAAIEFVNGGGIRFITDFGDRSGAPTLNEASFGALTKMVIQPSGYVGIGTTTPSAILDVAGHIGSSGSTPSIGSCGTSPSIVGTDTRGEITTGTGSPTSCTLSFATAYSSSPFCVVTPVGSNPNTQFWISAKSTAAITITFAASLNSQKFNYFCMK